MDLKLWIPDIYTTFRSSRCYFSHDIKEDLNKKAIDDIVNSFDEKHETIKSKIEKIYEKIAEFEAQEMEITKKLENIFIEKIEVLESKIATMRACIAEKDEVIQNFETRFRKLEENLLENENSLKKVNLEKKTDEVVHKCPSCSFTTTSEQGLKVHRKRKHTEQNFSKI